MQCDMCGSESDSLCRAIIEGVELTVCRPCSKYGKFLGPVSAAEAEKKQTKEKAKPKLPEKEIIELIVKDYSKLIKDKREKLGLKQKELAQKIAEKESIIHKLESGNFTPSLTLARKLERFLKIRLVEQHEEVPSIQPKTKPGTLTIGDFVKVRKR